MARTLRWIPILMFIIGICLIVGCSKEEAVEQGKDFLWTCLYIVVGIISLVLIVLAWAIHKAAGIVVTALVIVGLCSWYYLTRYAEPPENQPHARITFLEESYKGAFTIRIDGYSMGSAGKMEYYHPGVFSGSSDGEYTVRVTPGSHEIMVGWSYTTGTYTEETKKDLKCPILVQPGEARYILLSQSDLSGFLWRN